jgi:hypothetical protein
LDDTSEYDELMFSVIHAVERFDDEIYVSALLENLTDFYARSPRWAVIVHMRILNSPATMATYAKQLTFLPRDRRQVVRDVLEAVRLKNGKFEAKCNLLLATL